MTYSLGITGARADNFAQPLNQTITDTSARAPAAQQRAMMHGRAFLCKGPDGAERYYVYDAERSIPGVSMILTPLGP